MIEEDSVTKTVSCSHLIHTPLGDYLSVAGDITYGQTNVVVKDAIKFLRNNNVFPPPHRVTIYGNFEIEESETVIVVEYPVSADEAVEWPGQDRHPISPARRSTVTR